MPSDWTLSRTLRGIDADTSLLDVDSSLHQIHSENKDETAANYETMGVALRRGNA